MPLRKAVKSCMSGGTLFAESLGRDWNTGRRERRKVSLGPRGFSALLRNSLGQREVPRRVSCKPRRMLRSDFVLFLRAFLLFPILIPLYLFLRHLYLVPDPFSTRKHISHLLYHITRRLLLLSGRSALAILYRRTSEKIKGFAGKCSRTNQEKTLWFPTVRFWTREWRLKIWLEREIDIFQRKVFAMILTY